MRVSVQENALKPGKYRVVLHTGESASFEQFLDHVSYGTTLSRPDILAVFQAAKEWMLMTAGDGREANFGPLGRTRLGMKGQFDKVPERIEDADVQLTLSWVLPGEIAKRVAVFGKELVRKRVDPEPKWPNPYDARRVLSDASHDPVQNRYAPGCVMLLSGANLDYDSSQEDEGVFLIDEAGSATRMTQVCVHEPSRVMFQMPYDAEGTYRLEVRRRHPKGKGNPLTGRLQYPLVPVETSDPALVEV